MQAWLALFGKRLEHQQLTAKLTKGAKSTLHFVYLMSTWHVNPVSYTVALILSLR
jgi:hypothetical protein